MFIQTFQKTVSAQNLVKELEESRLLKSEVNSLSNMFSETVGTSEVIKRLEELWSDLSKRLQNDEDKSHASELALQPLRSF